MSPTASKIEASIENIDGHELSPDSKPGPIKSDQEYEPGWRTWLDRDNFAFLILGILVGDLTSLQLQSRLISIRFPFQS